MISLLHKEAEFLVSIESQSLLVSKEGNKLCVLGLIEDICLREGPSKMCRCVSGFIEVISLKVEFASEGLFSWKWHQQEECAQDKSSTSDTHHACLSCRFVRWPLVARWTRLRRLCPKSPSARQSCVWEHATDRVHLRDTFFMQGLVFRTKCASVVGIPWYSKDTCQCGESCHACWLLMVFYLRLDHPRWSRSLQMVVLLRSAACMSKILFCVHGNPQQCFMLDIFIPSPLFPFASYMHINTCSPGCSEPSCDRMRQCMTRRRNHKSWLCSSSASREL